MRHVGRVRLLLSYALAHAAMRRGPPDDTHPYLLVSPILDAGNCSILKSTSVVAHSQFSLWSLETPSPYSTLRGSSDAIDSWAEDVQTCRLVD